MVKKIGLTIKEIRTIRGISAAQLAKYCGVSAAAVSRWENGHNVPRYKKLEDIITFLRVPTSLFLDWIPESHLANMTEEDLDDRCQQYAIQDTIEVQAIYDFLYTDNIQLGKIFKSLNQLNTAGKDEAVKRVEELTQISRYRSKEK